jgi:hypothetical protein
MARTVRKLIHGEKGHYASSREYSRMMPPSSLRSRTGPCLEMGTMPNGLSCSRPDGGGGHCSAPHTRSTSAKMTFVENEQLIQALFPYRSHSPFGIGIGFRGTVGDIDDLHTFRLKHRVKRVGEPGIMIVDQIANGQRSCNTHDTCALAGSPSRHWDGPYSLPDEPILFCVQGKTKHTSFAAPKGLDGEQITCQQLVLVVIQEHTP